VLSAVPAILTAAPAMACAVCGGDKDSDMVKGALSGVVVMVAITYAVLLSFAGVGVMFFLRARRLSAAGEKPRASESSDC